MKNAVKKVLSIMLVAVMLFGAAPLSGFVGLELPDWLDFSKLFEVEAEAATYSGTCGSNLTWTFDESAGVLQISGTGAMNNYSYSEVPWYSYCSYIKTVKIGDGVTSIGDYAFYCLHCWSSDDAILIPDGVTRIGKCAFYIGYGTIVLPKSIRSIGFEAFTLTDANGIVWLPDRICFLGSEEDWQSVIKEKSDNWLKNTDILFDCKFENDAVFDSTLETLIRYFHNGNDSYIIPDCVIKIDDEAFYKCYSIASVTIPNSVTSIGGDAFYSCDSLTSITIPDSVTSIGNSAFAHCDSLTSVTIGNSVTSIGDRAFHSCDSLADVYYSGTEAEWNAISIGSYNGDLTNATIHYNYVPSLSFEVSFVDSLSGTTKTTSLQYDSLIPNPGEPYIEGYEFVGWYTEKGEKYVYGTSRASDSDTTYYAKYIKKEDLYNNSKIRAFSSKPQLRLGQDDEIDMLFEVETTVNGQAYNVPNTSFSFTSSDTDVFTVDNVSNSGNATSIKLNKKGTGSAILSVTAYYNGEYIVGGEYLITSDGDKVYYADTVPQTNGFNFISNGIVVDGFKCEKEECVDSSSTTTYTISFNAYNQANCIGSADVYNKDGELLYSKSIAAFTGNIPTGIWDTVKNLYEYFSQEFSKDSTYKDSINSEKTEICFANVPADGYISISNDVSSSMPCALYNISSLFVRITSEALSAAFPKPPSDDVINSATEALTKKILPEMLKSPATSKTIFKILEKFCQALSHGSESKEMDAVVDDYILLVDALNIDVGEILIDCAIDAGIGVVEGFIYVSLGPAGGIIKTAFKLFSLSKIATHIETLDKFVGSGKTAVYLPSSYPQKLYSNGYSVSSQLSFDSNITFHKYGITTGNDWNDAKQTFSDMKYIDVIGMDLYKDGIKVQPSGMVEVAIPIPDSFSSDDAKNIKVYRKESDGSYTELNCDYRDIANGYIYIKTDHFSVYCIVLDEVTELIDITFESAEISISIDDYAFNEPIFNPTNAYETNLVWSSSDENVAKVTDSGFVVGISLGTTTITATANDNVYASYVVNVEPVKHSVVWNIDGVETTTTIYEGAEITKPNDPEKTGYTFVGWTPEIPDIMPAEDLMFTAVFEANSYDAVFDADGGAWPDGATEKTISVKFDDVITTPEVPTKQGYVFSKWTPEIGVMDSTDGKAFTAEWISATDTRYIVETYIMNTEGEYEKSSQVFSGTTDSTVSVEAEEKTGFTFNSEKSVTEGTVKADNSLVLKVYYDRNKYAFTTVTDGVSSTENYYYGATIVTPASPEKQGYKFIKWEGEIPETMPAEAVTITAVFEKSYTCPDCGKEILGEVAIDEHIAAEARMKATVEIKNNSGSNTIKYGETLCLTAITTDMPADVIVCWYVNGEKKGEGETFELSFESGTKTVEVKLVDAKGNVLKNASGNEIKDTETVIVKAGFFQKLIAFFKKLFGISQTVVQSIYF